MEISFAFMLETVSSSIWCDSATACKLSDKYKYEYNCTRIIVLCYSWLACMIRKLKFAPSAFEAKLHLLCRHFSFCLKSFKTITARSKLCNAVNCKFMLFHFQHSAVICDYRCAFFYSWGNFSERGGMFASIECFPLSTGNCLIWNELRVRWM